MRSPEAIYEDYKVLFNSLDENAIKEVISNIQNETWKTAWTLAWDEAWKKCSKEFKILT